MPRTPEISLLPRLYPTRDTYFGAHATFRIYPFFFLTLQSTIWRITIYRRNNRGTCARLKGLSKKLTLIPDKIFPLRKDPPAGFYTLVICPRVKKARYENRVRPYLSNVEALKAMSKASGKQDWEHSFFDYSSGDVPFICNGIRISE